MGEKSKCDHCRTWEEEMYWKNFNSMHFCQILPNNFHDHLVLPEKFAAHMTTQLPDKVSLTGPSGAVWDIELQKTNDLLLVGDGWKDFVKAYGLEENCLLLFKYKRNSGFEVLIFDREAFCEKEAAYFVKKCGHPTPEHKEHKKRTVREGSCTDVLEDDSEEHSSANLKSKKSKKDAEDGIVCSGQEKNTDDPRIQTSHAAAKGRGRGRPRKVVTPTNSPSESKAQCKETPARNEATQEQCQISLRYMTSPENVESSPEKDHAENGESSPEKNHAENGESSPEKDHAENGESSPEKGRAEDVMDKSEYNVAEKNPGGNDTVQTVCPISTIDWTIPEDQDDFSEANHSEKINSPSGKQPSENGIDNTPSQISGRGLIILDNGENSPEANHFQKPRRKRGRPRKEATSKSSLKRVSRSAVTRYNKDYMSNRRAVTEMEKKDALRRASQELTENSFVVVMRPTCVYKRFYLSIPVDWMNKHLPLRHQNIILRMGDKTWDTVFYYNNKRSVGGLCPGWKKFALENSLEEFDVLHFKLDKQNDGAAIVFDVDIFRVVPEILPPLLVDSSVLT